MTCESCDEFTQFFCRALGEGGGLIDRVIIWGIMTRVKNEELSGAEALKILKESFGKKRVNDTLSMAREEGYI